MQGGDNKLLRHLEKLIIVVPSCTAAIATILLTGSILVVLSQRTLPLVSLLTPEV
jgi:hypothetical protein